ncbi:nucleotidyltransferase domain-containing protein [Anaerotruncus rubiinfantis]|uniref:nucleotidyltransferase domain-containing protein n=1 Tax=Anaerotruncus rubiinfantis TaxID=1720200 RepID=UPI003D7B8701
MCTQFQLHQILSRIYHFSAENFLDSLDAVVLYGSYARGDYDEDSDIDVMVRVKMPKQGLCRYRKTFSHLGSDLGLEYGVVISIHLQDLETFEHYRRHLPFYRNIDREGVTVSA